MVEASEVSGRSAVSGSGPHVGRAQRGWEDRDALQGPWLWPRVRSFHEITKEAIDRFEVVLKRVVGVQRGRMTPLKITVILMGLEVQLQQGEEIGRDVGHRFGQAFVVGQVASETREARAEGLVFVAAKMACD